MIHVEEYITPPRGWRYRLRRVLRSLDNAKWWVVHRFHPKHRYHVIHTGLEPGWYDRDFLMAHLMVKLLIDFVEKEEPFEQFDTVNSPNATDWVKLKGLYEFFKQGWENLDEDVLDAKLREILDIRGLMWT